MRKFLLLMFCLGLVGCATTPLEPIAKPVVKPIPTQEELAKMDYGKPISIDYQTIIKDYFSKNLKDPFTAHYQFAEPQPYWYRDSQMMGGKEYVGYAVIVLVNAKNGFGGYVGDKQYAFIFRDDLIIKVVDPVEFEIMGYANSFKK